MSLKAIGMISSAYKFIFIHIPKTGGNSIQSMLLPFADDVKVIANENQDGVDRFGLSHKNFPTQKHSTLSEYRALVPEDELAGFYKFSVIRNPWDRAISYYFSGHHRVQREWDRHRFLDTLREVHPIGHYLRHSSEQRSSILDPTYDVNKLIKFENLEDDFSDVCDRLGLGSLSLPQRNASIRTDYRDYYDEELINMIALKYAEEIEYGGYTF